MSAPHFILSVAVEIYAKATKSEESEESEESGGLRKNIGQHQASTEKKY